MATPATRATNDPAAAMVWEEARRLIVRQEAVLDTLRVQAVAILSVTSIVAGLFGAHLLPTDPSGSKVAAIAAALVLFGVTALKVILILTPRDWTFEHALTEKLAQLESGKQLLKAGSLAYTWAKEAEAARTANKVQLDRLMEYFRWACILTAVQVVVWGLALL